MTNLTKIVTTSLLLSCSSTVAFSQASNLCDSREKIVKKLSEQYGETLRSEAISHTNTVVENWASDTTGTWTITVTYPNGKTCFVAAGSHFYQVPPAQKPKEGDRITFKEKD